MFIFAFLLIFLINFQLFGIGVLRPCPARGDSRERERAFSGGRLARRRPAEGARGRLRQGERRSRSENGGLGRVGQEPGAGQLRHLHNGQPADFCHSQ